MAKLTHNSYGKSLVRLTKVTRLGGRHDIQEIAVDIELQGDFAKSYTHGDNSLIVATDTMKNTVYALARKHSFNDSETFGQILGSHFLKNNKHVTAAWIRLSESLFERINNHPHAFSGGGAERRTATVRATRSGTTFESGIDGLLVLKTTDSEFTGYLRDEFTTLKETRDRIFATILTANWIYSTPPTDFNSAHAKVRAAMLKTFAEHYSLAVQQTLYAMGDAALSACAEIQVITLTMPNKHRLLANLQPFGLENPNEIFVTTDEPFGKISGTISRE